AESALPPSRFHGAAGGDRRPSPRRQGRGGARSGRRREHPDHLLFGEVVEHAASGRFGESHQGSDHGGDDADRHGRDGFRLLVLQHRGCTDAGALHHARARTHERVGSGLREGIRVNWGGPENFLVMGGYALYVWGSYLVTLGLVIAEIVLLALRKRRALARLRLRGTAAQGDR